MMLACEGANIFVNMTCYSVQNFGKFTRMHGEPLVIIVARVFRNIRAGISTERESIRLQSKPIEVSNTVPDESMRHSFGYSVNPFPASTVCWH
jgi:hypothetical protein